MYVSTYLSRLRTHILGDLIFKSVSESAFRHLGQLVFLPFFVFVLLFSLFSFSLFVCLLDNSVDIIDGVVGD